MEHCHPEFYSRLSFGMVARRLQPNRFLYGPVTSPGASDLYVLDTQGLGKGTHVLTFAADGGPVPHTAPGRLEK